jgi:hypothetical protein
MKQNGRTLEDERFMSFKITYLFLLEFGLK